MSAEATDQVESTNGELHSIAQAMSEAAAKVKDGAAGVSTRLQKASPAAGRLLSRFTYSSCYYVSYGVVFPTMFLAHYVPGGHVVASGMLDGALAAQDAVKELAAKKRSALAAAEHAEHVKCADAAVDHSAAECST